MRLGVFEVFGCLLCLVVFFSLILVWLWFLNRFAGFVAWLTYVVFEVMWYGCFGLVALGWVGGDSGVCGFWCSGTLLVWFGLLLWWFCYLVGGWVGFGDFVLSVWCLGIG